MATRISSLCLRCAADRLLKMLKHARLHHLHEAELRELLAIDVPIIDDFCLDTIESRDVHEILTERDRAGSVVITLNRGPGRVAAEVADPVRAQAAIDRFTSTASDLVIEGESYRKHLKPKSSRPRGWTEEWRIGQLIGVMRRQEPGRNAPENLVDPSS